MPPKSQTHTPGRGYTDTLSREGTERERDNSHPSLKSSLYSVPGSMSKREYTWEPESQRSTDFREEIKKG